jgi:hypothetical protein
MLKKRLDISQAVFFNSVQCINMKGSFGNIISSLGTVIFMFTAFLVMYLAFTFLQVDLKPIFTLVISFSPIWLPIVLFYITFEMWMSSVREKFKYENGRSTLRIKLPQEVFKSPEAMESVFNQVYNAGGGDNLMHIYLDGRKPLVLSFEIVSIGGEVRFYANVPTKKTKNTLEAQLYAQYPGIEITEELIDYTAEVTWDPEKWDLLSFHILKKGEDILPIKTYIDYGMDKLPKEELKFEPMAPLLEHLGKAKPHERLWIQILTTAHTKEGFDTGHLSKKSTWESLAQKKIDEIMGRNKNKLGVEETDTRPILTMSERDTIAAIERNVAKYAFKVAIRAMYITTTGKFDAEMIGPMLRSFSQYDIIGRNGIGVKWRTDFDYNFISDPSGSRKIAMKKSELESYKSRSYETGDKKTGVDAEKIMSTEELATIYHIPGTAIVTPSLSRVETTRKEAPANLPIAKNS